MPTDLPSVDPTLIPSHVPTLIPSMSPTIIPTIFPTQIPSFSPSLQPSVYPTDTPSYNPTNIPSIAPTIFPTLYPTKLPTVIPTYIPSIVPSHIPSINPSHNPTVYPTVSPTTRNPTAIPSLFPSHSPSSQPTANPLNYPSIVPTNQPTLNPSKNPSNQQTNPPTNLPTKFPTIAISKSPTVIPSSITITTQAATTSPTRFENPSAQPSIIPSITPSLFPFNIPTTIPSTHPTNIPTTQPSNIPSQISSYFPTQTPTGIPSGIPTIDPTLNPSTIDIPSAIPSSINIPTRIPFVQPVTITTHIPSNVGIPTEIHSRIPSDIPTLNPTIIPNNYNPSQSPTFRITVSPTSNPTFIINYNPTNIPTDFTSTVASHTPNIFPTHDEYPTDSTTINPTAFPSDEFANPTHSSPVQLPTNAPTNIKPLRTSTTSATTTMVTTNNSSSDEYSSTNNTTKKAGEFKNDEGNVVNLFKSVRKHLKRLIETWNVFCWIVAILALFFIFLTIISFVINDIFYVCCCICNCLCFKHCSKIDDNKPFYILLYGLQIVDIWSDLALVYQLFTNYTLNSNTDCLILALVGLFTIILVQMVNFGLSIFYIKSQCQTIFAIARSNNSKNIFATNWLTSGINYIFFNILVFVSGSVYYSIIFVNCKLFGSNLFTFGLSNFELFTFGLSKNNIDIFFKIHLIINFVFENICFFVIQFLLLFIFSKNDQDHDSLYNLNDLLQYWILIFSFIVTIIMILCVLFILIKYIIFGKQYRLESCHFVIESNANKYNCWKMGQFSNKRNEMAKCIKNAFQDIIDIDDKVQCCYVCRTTNGINVKIVCTCAQSTANNKSDTLNNQCRATLSKPEMNDKIRMQFAKLFQIFDPQTLNVHVEW